LKFKKIFVIIILENKKKGIDKKQKLCYTVFTVKKGSALNDKEK